MTTTNYVSTPKEGVDFNATYTSYDQTAAVSSTNSPDNPGPPFVLGDIVSGTGDSEFVFVKASAAITLGDVVQITTAFNASAVTTSAGSFGLLLGVAPVAIASGAYGWVQRSGYCSGGIRVVGSTGDNVQLYTTTVGGVISSAATTGNKTISGIIITATAGSTTGAVAGIINKPVMGVTTT